MGKIIVNETAKQSTKPTKKSLTSAEAEVISEEADSFDESRTEKSSALIVARPMVQSARRKSGKRSMSGMVMDVAPSARPNHAQAVNSHDDENDFEKTSRKSKKIAEKSSSDKSSRMKATIIAVVVALLVGVAGGLIVWFMGRDTTEYCTVQFESSGGTKIESEKIACGNTVERPDDPTKEGFEFQDWLYDGMPFGFGVQEVNEDIKLVAKWLMSEGTEAVTVTFDSDGGSEVEEHIVAKGKTTTEPVAPTRDGYDFLGWFINGREFDFSKPINEDITVVAAWEKKPETQKPSKDEKPNSSSSDNKVSAVKVSPASRTVKAGEEFELTVSVEPKNAKYNLAVKSSADGVVACNAIDAQASTKISCKAVAPGKATVEIRDQHSNRTASIDITVEKVDVTGVTLSKSELTLTVGEVKLEFLSAKVLPENATDKGLSWASSNDAIVAVAEDGTITGVAEGEAIITVTTTDGGKTAECKVTVLPAVEEGGPGDGEVTTPQ